MKQCLQIQNRSARGTCPLAAGTRFAIRRSAVRKHETTRSAIMQRHFVGAVVLLGSMMLYAKSPGDAVFAGDIDVLHKRSTAGPRSARSNWFDRTGKRTGSSRTAGSRTTYYNRTGRVVGVRRGNDRRATMSDRNGRTIQRSRTSDSRTSYYDRNGRGTGYSRTQGKRTIYYNRAGQRTGYSRSSTGRTTFYDRAGRISGWSSRRN